MLTGKQFILKKTYNENYLWLSDSNLLHLKKNNVITVTDLNKNTSVTRKNDYNQIYYNFTDPFSNKVVELEINWKYNENKIISICDKNNKPLHQFKNTKYEKVEVIKDMFYTENYYVTIVFYTSPEKCYFILIDLLTDQIYRFKSYKLYNENCHSGIKFSFFSTLFDKNFILSNSNEILLNEMTNTTRKTNKYICNIVNCENDFIVYNKNYKLKSLGLKTDFFLNKKITNLSFSVFENNLYYIEKNKLFIIKLFNISEKEVLELDERIKDQTIIQELIIDDEEPNSSVISSDSKYICLIYDNKVKVYHRK